jgi:type I restriction enzyme S subunit
MKLNKVKFSSLYEMSSGISSTPEQAGVGLPFLSFSSVFNNYFVPEKLNDLMDTSLIERDTYSIKEGDVFLTRTSETLDELAISCVALEDYPDATFSGFVKRLRPISENATYPKFMGFYLRNELFRRIMSNNAIMTLRASFNEDIFSYLDLYLPDYDTQKKIGDFLYKIFSKIEINEKTNFELRSIATNLYNYWFIQYEFPNKDNKPYKSSGGDFYYNTNLKKDIPVEWLDGYLGNSIISDNNGSGINDFKNEKNYLSTSEVNNTNIINHNNEITYSNRPSRANMQPTYDSIWFAKMKNTKKYILVSEFSIELCEQYLFSTGFAGIKTKNKSLYYLWHFINSSYFEKVKDLRAVGTTQKAVNNDFINQLKILIPNEAVLIEFNKVTKPIYSKIYNNERENLELSNLINWILPMLMNGQVTVKEAKEHINQAAEQQENYSKSNG